MTYELKRPGSDRWESEADFPGGVVPAADLAGCLVRYHTGSCPLVLRVLGLGEPDAAGVRHLRLELYEGEGNG